MLELEDADERLAVEGIVNQAQIDSENRDDALANRIANAVAKRFNVK